MMSTKSFLLLSVATFAFLPTVAFAQVPDDVQSSRPSPIVGASQTEQAKLAADQRTREIESARSDIADLSKFEHDQGYLPKSFYKRSYADSQRNEMVADSPPSPEKKKHHM